MYKVKLSLLAALFFSHFIYLYFCGFYCTVCCTRSIVMCCDGNESVLRLEIIYCEFFSFFNAVLRFHIFFFFSFFVFLFGRDL